MLASRVGKEKPQRMRNYSHFVAGGVWIPLGKGDKAMMADILLNEDWTVAVVAESGQKHILFRAVPGTVQFEEHQVRDTARLGEVLDWVEELYTGGMSKGQIASGRYPQRRILDFGLAAWMRLENHIKAVRSSGAFELAVFLAQKRGEA